MKNWIYSIFGCGQNETYNKLILILWIALVCAGVWAYHSITSSKDSSGAEYLEHTELKTELEENLTGSWSFYDRNTGIQYSLQLIDRSDGGTYLMTDFGGDGLITGQWEKRGDVLKFKDETFGNTFATGIYIKNNNTITVNTQFGNLYFKK